MSSAVNIGAEFLARNPKETLNLNHPIDWDVLPLGNRTRSDVEVLSDLGVEPALRANEVYSVHTSRLALLSAEVKRKRRKPLSDSERRSGDLQGMDIGDLIKERRMKRKLSQKALAEQLGVNKSAVAQWETNATRPTEANMAAIKIVLGITAGPEAPPGSPYRGKLVEDPHLLVWLNWLEGLSEQDKIAAARLLAIHSR